MKKKRYLLYYLNNNVFLLLMYFSFIGDLELLFLESKFLFILSEKQERHKARHMINIIIDEIY